MITESQKEQAIAIKAEGEKWKQRVGGRRKVKYTRRSLDESMEWETKCLAEPFIVFPPE